MSELDYNGMFEYLYGMKYGEKFNSKDYNIVSYQLEEKTVGEMTTYYVTMVIKSKKYNDEGMLLTLLQDFHDITVHRIE